MVPPMTKSATLFRNWWRSAWRRLRVLRPAPWPLRWKRPFSCP